MVCATRTQNTGSREIAIYQVQASIAHGSSGGGLYDVNGALLGVNTWTETTATGEGMAFAISAKSILEALPADAAARFLEPTASTPEEVPR